ncbi:MAG: VOC family protein, partial [Pseudomonadota bacterium]
FQNKSTASRDGVMKAKWTPFAVSAFMTPSREAVDLFWKKALEAGATPEGEPGPRPHYGKPYYGCFMRDPDGHKIEAMYWDAAADA